MANGNDETKHRVEHDEEYADHEVKHDEDDKIEHAKEMARQSILTDIAAGLQALSTRTSDLREDVQDLEDAMSERVRVFLISLSLLGLLVLVSIGFWIYTTQVRQSLAQQACESTNTLADSIVQVLANAEDDPDATPDEQERSRRFRQRAIENIQSAKC